MKILIPIFLILLLIAMAGVLACDTSDDPLEKIDVQLKWIHQAQFAGFYAADQTGLYAQEGIDVNLIPSGPDMPVDEIIDRLLDGRVDFTIAAADQLLMRRAEGDPLVAIAVIFPKNPYVYVVPKDSPIKSPRDFPGKTMMLGPGSETQHKALLSKFDIDPASITILPYEKSPEPLESGRIDAHLLYRSGSALLFDQEEYPVDFLWLANYDIRFYADTIVTTEEIIQTRPDLVEKFLRATLEGWRYAIENQAETVDFIRKYDPNVDVAVQILASRIQTPLIHTGDTKIGWMEGEIWQEMTDILQSDGSFSETFDVAAAYTTEFLEAIYGDKTAE